MAKLDLRNQRPKVEKLPDGRLRATFVYDVLEQVGRTQAELTAEVWLAWGTVAPGDFTGLRLVKQDIDGTSPQKNSSLPLVRVYEELPATSEIQVGANAYSYPEDGGKTTVAEFIQFTAGTYAPGTVGTTTAPGDATSYLQNEDATSDGTLRRIKRTYTDTGELSVTNETKNNGALLMRTIVSVKTVPSTPGGYTLISTAVKNTQGLPTYTYTFAQGTGQISREDSTSNNGALLTATIRYLTVPGVLGTAGDSPITTPVGYTPVSQSFSEADGHRIWTGNYAKGTGKISEDIDYSQSSDQGATGITRTTIRYLVVPTATVQPTALAYSVKIGESVSESDGHRIWTTKWAKGTGTISTQNETKYNGALLLRTVRALGAAPSTPIGYARVSTDSAEQDGFTIYTYSFAQGSGEISRSVDYSQSNDFGVTGVARTTIRHLTPTATVADPTALANSVKISEDKTEADGHRIWSITYARGAGLVSDDTDYSNQGALTRYHRVSLGSIPTSPSGASGALSRITVTNGGSGYTSAPTVTISGGGGSGATATAVLSNRSVISLTVSNGGSGYTSAPTVALTSGGGTGASATAVLATRTVASIAVSAPGSGYTSTPSVSVAGDGTGSTAAAVLTGTTVASIALTSAGTGYTSIPTVDISGGGGSGATATVNVAGGSIFSLTLTAPGSGYTSAPTLSFSGGGGTGAGATCALTATTVASVAVTASGSGFTSTPTVAVAGGSGSGATVTAALTGTTIANITVTAAGSGYTSTPTVSFSGGGGTGATGTVVLTGRTLTSITVTNAGSGYTVAPTVSFSGGGGSGAAATVSLAGTTLASATLGAAGSGFTSTPTVSLSGGGGSSGAVTAALTGTTVASVSLTSVGSGFTSAPTVGFSGGGGTGAAASINISSGVGVNITNGGSGYYPDGNYVGTVLFSGGGGSGVNAIATISGGQLVGFHFDPSLFPAASSGSGYTSAPTLDFSAFNSYYHGTGAAGTAILGGVSYVRIVSAGSGYTSTPTVTISGGGGSGAAAFAWISPGPIYQIVVTNPGSGYTSAPTVTISGGGGTGATATAFMIPVLLNSLTLTNAGSGYTSTPTVSFSGGGGTGSAATATLAATTLATLTLSNAGTGYTSAPTLAISGGGGAGGTGTITLTPTTVASIAVTSGGTGYTGTPTVAFAGGGGGSGATATAGMASSSVASVTVSNAGAGYTSAPTLTISGGGGSAAEATAAITPTTLASLTLSAPGTGYTSSPTLTISGGGGTGAAGVATLTSTTIASVAVSASGSGYTTTPTVVFTGGGGSGATASVSSTGVTVTGFTITAAGSGYTSGPAAVVSGGGGSGAYGTPVLTGTTVASVTVTAAGSGFTVAPTVTFTGGGGSGAVAAATLSTAAVTSLTITAAGTGYTSAPTVGFSGGGGSGAAATAAVSTGSVLSVTLTAGGSSYASIPTIAFSGGAGSGATAFSPAGLAAVLVSANVRKEAGFDVYDYTWAAGAGVIAKRYQQRSGGLRLETWVSIGQIYDTAYMLPTGVLMAKDYEDNAGHSVFTVTTMQLAGGGVDPTSGTALTIQTMHPFRYPGRAKTITTTVLAKTCYDVYKSPPADVLVDATVTITYQTSSSLGAISDLWNPDSWATIIATYYGWNASPKAIIESLPGYRAISEVPVTFSGGSSGGDQTCLGERLYGSGVPNAYSLAVKGGPAAPDGNLYTLSAELDPEPAFVAYDGTTYYRKTVVSATIPAQAALPTL